MIHTLTTLDVPVLWEIGKASSQITMTPYSAWLDKWQSNWEDTRSTPHIPVSARNVNTPLIEDAWGRCLTHYPNQPLTRFSLQGLREGFHIGFNSHFLPNLKSSRKNLEGAIQHPAVVDKYLEEKVALGRVAGPFRKSDLTRIQISRFGVIPKSHQKDKWRLIIDLSHPKGNSVNDGIPKPLCGLSYITIDDAINGILRSGPNTLLAKIDIKSAFRLLPVHPADRHLLAIEWKNSIFIDACLPFGLRSAPKLFNILADLLSYSVWKWNHPQTNRLFLGSKNIYNLL